MKFLSACLLMLLSSLACAGTLEIINDANINIFVSDHNQTAMLLMPGQSNIFESKQAHTVLYVYTETDKAQQFYTLSFQVVEKFQDHRKTTLLFNDIANNNLQLLYPNRFTVLTAEDMQKHKHHTSMQTTPEPSQQTYTPTAPTPQPPYQPADMRAPTSGGDISPELVQSILAQIQRSQQTQKTQQFNPYQQQHQPQPSSDHIVGHHHHQPPAQTRKPNTQHQHHHTAPPIPTSTQASKQPSAHTGHHHHKHNHTHSSKSKRERNLHRGSKFMSDNKK